MPLLSDALALPPTDARLPTEVAYDWAFADCMAGAVSIKTADYVAYMSFMWRDTDKIHRPGNLTRVDFRGRRYGALGMVATNTSGPQLRLWSLRFGDLLIAMNVNLRSVIGERV